MGYNSAIPQPTDARALSQSQILSNYQTIAKVWADNHYPLNGDQNTTFKGMHNVLTIRPQTGDPTTAADQTALYNKLVSTIPQLFFRPHNNATPIQLTYKSIKADLSDTQYSFIAGPFIVYGGFITTPTNGQQVTLTPGSSLIYVGLTPSNVKGVFNVVKSAFPTNINSSPGANSFTITFDASITVGIVYYFAIGLP